MKFSFESTIQRHKEKRKKKPKRDIELRFCVQCSLSDWNLDIVQNAAMVGKTVPEL